MNAAPLALVAPMRAGWLVDRRSDLLSTVGGTAASLVLLALHVVGGVDSLLLWWAWILLLDGPHIFATLSRTYLDKRERETRGRLLLGSLGWFAAGPLAFALSAALESRLPFELFTLLYRGLGCGFGAHPGCGAFEAGVTLAAGLSLRELVTGFIWGFALHHYYLDQHIWRVSRDAGLHRDLKLEKTNPRDS